MDPQNLDVESEEPPGPTKKRGRARRIEHPSISVGTAAEYAFWVSRLRMLMVQRGAAADALEQVNARLNYKGNQITLYRLANRSEPRSLADTLSHEFLHALLYQMGEEDAARAIDLVGKPVGNSARRGGI